MIRFILRRMLLMIPVLLGVMFIVFTINYFGPGDPVAALLGGNYTQEQYDAKEKGKNEYAGNGGKHRKKENSEKDGVVVTKQHQGFDIKI